MKITLKHALPLFTLLLFSGCSLWNPFVPNNPQEISYEHTPSQPIKTKAMYRATMRPYTIEGITYTPIIPNIGDRYHGIASWYGPNFHGNQTSNGEYYDMHQNTAAHKTLPINTLLQVTNDQTGASTIVRINDRGPFVKSRIIDLSHQAALEIGVIKHGTAQVSLEVLDFDQSVIPYAHTLAPKPKPIATKPVQKSYQPLLYKVQIVSTQNQQKAKELVKKYAIMKGQYQASIKTRTFWQKTYYKVLIGDFHTADEAQNFIADNYFDGAFIVKD